MTQQERERKMEFLCGYRDAWLRERAIESDIAMLRMQRMSIPGMNADGTPRGSSPGDLSDYAAAVDELLRAFTKEAKRKLAIRREIQERIDAMDNLIHRLVLTYRYLSLVQTPAEKANNQVGTKLRSYESIAKKMSYTVDHVKRLHARALEDIKV